MKRSLIACLAVVFLVVSATPSLASEHGQICANFEHGVGAAHQKVRVCVAVNVHDAFGWKEAALHVDVLDSPTNGYLTIDRDYLRLYRNGVIVEVNNWDSVICLDYDGGCAYTDSYDASTDWYGGGCSPGGPDFYGSFRYRISFAGGGYGNWQSTSSNLTHSCA